MFEWIRRLLFQNKRFIFSYFDGSHIRWADPLVIGSNLERICPKYYELFQLLAEEKSPIPGPLRIEQQKRKLEATDEIIKAVQDAFEVERFKDVSGKISGLTKTEMVALLSQFLEFMGGLSGGSAAPLSRSPLTGSDYQSPVLPTETSVPSGGEEKT